jgi:hypothetical protein
MEWNVVYTIVSTSNFIETVKMFPNYLRYNNNNLTISLNFETKSTQEVRYGTDKTYPLTQALQMSLKLLG